ncbi:MAG: ribonuclease J [Acidimicrobiales bacterium]
MSESVSITFLGGLGDIGRNCAAIESGDELLLLDCGQLFPDESMPGADSVLPDLSYLEDKGDKIVGCITTHGHEDHIGALSHALRRFTFPIYGSAFTMGMVRNRLDEAGVLGRTDLRAVADNEVVDIGGFRCEFLPVTHSVPSGLISVIGTPQGLILHSSDFKLDPSPVDGRVTDMNRIGELATEPGIRLLLCDSTNADVPGTTQSESEIGPVLRRVFEENEGRRIITASFSSHIHRVQQIADAALASGRKIATLGMSMKRNVALARELGLLRIPDTEFVDLEEVDAFAPGEVCIISTGSQAEPRSALALAATSDSRWIKIGENDTVVLSSHPVPGNEARVYRMVDELVRRGARVRHTGHLGLHTSGHGKQEELEALHRAASPQWFVPVHGEFHHLVAHVELAEGLGMPPDHMFLATDGDQIVLSDEGLRLVEGVSPGGYTFVDGDLTEDDHDLFRERLILGEEGVVVAMATVDLKRQRLIGQVSIQSRGWLGDEHYDDLTDTLRAELRSALLGHLDESDPLDIDELERRIRRTVGQFVSSNTGRRPMIVPVVNPA